MKKNIKQVNFSKEKLEIISAVFAVVLLYAAMEIIGITCPIKFITGISCAGCGMSRAWLSFFKFDIAGAFYFHPLFFLPPIAVIILFFKPKIKPSLFKIFFFTIIALFAIIYLYRLIICDNDIVVFEPQNNIIFRIVRLLMKKEGVV